MKRRNAVKQIGLGLSAGLILPTWLSSCSEDDPDPQAGSEGTVGIVGAGAAGLFVADILKAKGFNVVIFEASARVGGRVKTLKSIDKPSSSLLFTSQTELSSDFPSELGASQVLGSDSIWGKIVEQLKITTVDLNATTTDNYFLDGFFTDASTAEVNADFIAAKAFYDNLSSYAGPNVSVEQAIAAAGISPNMYGILNSWIGNKHGTSNERLSIKALTEGLNLRTRNNTLLTLSDNPVQDALLSRFSKVIADVQVNTVVKEINYTGEKIIVAGDKAADGDTFSMEVDKLIVTVPISILKNGSITFTPALPASKTAALSAMDMDAAIRVLLDFKGNFWGENSGFLYGSNEAPEYFNSGAGRSELSRTMEITVMGPKAASLSLLGNGIIPVLISDLDSIFDGKATINVRKDFNDNVVAVIQDWTLEPFIHGGVSYLKPGGTNQSRIALAEPINNKVFFAGEAADVNGESGTLNGALLSGERAAQEVIDSF